MDEYNKVSSCISAKEIWDKLEVTHEGTTQVKDDNINMLVHDYELFNMEPNESLTSMYSRFSVNTNALNLLGKIYSNEDKIRKILRVLPKKWRPKVTAIQEAKNLKTLSMDELLGSLKTHDKELQREEEEEKANPKKIFALKNIQSEVNDENDTMSGDEDMTLLSRKFLKFLAKKKYSQECPVRRKEKEKKENVYKKLKHALKGPLSESEEGGSDDESSDEESANLCLMAKHEEVYQSLPHR